MSANYCEARHKATGIPETHCFHATGKMKRMGRGSTARAFSQPARPIEQCCWCEERTLGFSAVEEHGPNLDKIQAARGKVLRSKAGKK